jgi:hypothetical protein
MVSTCCNRCGTECQLKGNCPSVYCNECHNCGIWTPGRALVATQTDGEARQGGFGAEARGQRVNERLPRRKGRKVPYTPHSRVRASLRQLWLRSRERAAAVKRESNTCEICGKKGSVAKGRGVKIEVHHLEGIDWQKIEEYIYRHLLVNPDALQVLCKECHHKITAGEV